LAVAEIPRCRAEFLDDGRTKAEISRRCLGHEIGLAKNDHFS
jgi:hypothetical protein